MTNTSRSNEGIWKKRHWDEVVNSFNVRTGKSFEQKHLKAKIDGLKKQYRHESVDVVN